MEHLVLESSPVKYGHTALDNNKTAGTGCTYINTVLILMLGSKERWINKFSRFVESLT